MTAYARPAVVINQYTDATGNVIDYGRRYWTVDLDPPEAMYGHCAHPERFAPVEVVAHALIDYLASAYEVDATEAVVDGHTIVTLTPAAGATITFALPLARVPGVKVSAGLRFTEMWPTCGCDACDDSVPELLDLLEATVLTIVEGGLSEWRSGPGNAMPMMTDDAGNPVGAAVVPWQVHTRLDGRIESEGGGWSSNEPEPVELPEVPYRWERWPLKLA